MSERGKELFETLIELPAGERSSFLSTCCSDDPELRRELQALLRAHEAAGDFLAYPAEIVAAIAGDAGGEDGGSEPGDTIGHYELVEQLGAGGSGVVWRARQLHPVVRDVALKLLRRGRDGDESALRFRAEWQLLARMQHPGVAKVFDAGVLADGRPWLAMELVEGAPITEHALGAGLSLRSRLGLFTEVCRAVQHAHQKGVVHRDLKPSNVLVTQRDGAPRPVVIDFGIAAADDLGVGAAGVDGFRFGTPEYMSPEQAGADALAVDVRTDVYALGVLLYELACGERPHRRPAGPDAARRLLAAIRTQTPTPPSRRTAQRVPRDLDRVVACAMAKDPSDRYPSAAALADDVLRVLADEPIAAAPTSSAGRFALFLRRHRLAAATGGAIVLALAVGLVGAVVGHRDARRAEAAARVDQQRAEAATAVAVAERDRAKRESQKAHRALDLLDDLWANVDTSRMARPDYPVHELLRDYERVVTASASGEPEVELRLRCSLTKLHVAAGKQQSAIQHATRAIELAQAIGVPAREVEARILRAIVLMETDYRAAERDVTAALALATPERDVEPRLRAQALELRVKCMLRVDRLQDALADAEAALRLREADGGAHGLACALQALARVLITLDRVGDSDVAVAHSEKAIELLAPFGEKDPASITAILQLAVLKQRRGELEAAETLYLDGMRRQRLLYGEDHWAVAATRSSLAWLLYAHGRFDEAEPMLKEALAVFRRDLGEQSARASEAILRLGAIAAKRGDLAAAEALLADAVERYETLPSHHGEGRVASLGQLACVQWHRGRRTAAQATQQKAVDRAQRALPATHRAVTVEMTRLADMHAGLGDLAAAEALYRDALARSEQAGRVDEAALQRNRLAQLQAPASSAVEASTSSGR
ncbi:MAG: protein kinase domain-containing protein [Planctomycetota bacterium]